LSEISQVKGLLPKPPAAVCGDEFANYEILDFHSEDRGFEVVRQALIADALGRGLVVQKAGLGINPFKYGFAARPICIAV